MKACPACHKETLVDFYRVEQVPIQQNTPKQSVQAARDVLRGDIQLAYCAVCGFVTNRLFDPMLPIYGADYNNCQSHSSVFSDYVQSIVHHLDNQHGLKGTHVIEVGCGEGTFLELLCETKGITGVGFDPSYTGDDTSCDGNLRFVREYYGIAHADESADLVIARHLIEHIHNLDDLMRVLQQALAEQKAALFFETPDVRWILKHVTFWDIFYEHCSLFSPGSIARLFTKYGFNVPTVSSAFGAQYMWLDANTASSAGYPDTLDTPEQIATLAESFAHSAQAKIDTVREQIAYYQQQNQRVAIWGAGAKGVTFLNTLKPDNETVPVVVDINPDKQGRFIPGTAQEIIAPATLIEYDVRMIYIMNPNYEAEIKAQLADLALDTIETITIK